MQQKFDAGAAAGALFWPDHAAGPLPLIWLTVFDEAEGAEVWRLLTAERTACALACAPCADWNGALSPWPAPALRRDEPDFAGGGRAALHRLTETLLPRAEALLPAPPLWRGIAGYSMAGLFALWALYQTDAFTAAAGVSASFWYDGFAAYAETNGFAAPPRALYLSLGRKEALARSPRLAAGEACARRLAAHWQAACPGTPVRFELNPGGHFTEPARRTARGIAALCRMEQEERHEIPQG